MNEATNEAVAQQPQQQAQQPAVQPAPASIWGTVNNQPLRLPVVGVSGEHDSGKSVFISTIDPTRTCMIDVEESTVSYNLPFRQRFNLYEQMAVITQGRVFRPIQAWEWFSDLVQKIEPGMFTVLAVDPISDIEHGAVDWVKDHHAEFGLSKSQVENASGLLWGAVNEFWKAFIGTLSSKVHTLAYTVHMGSVWKAGRPVEGKRKAKGKSSLKEVTSLFLELDRSPYLDNQGQLVTPNAPTGVRTGGKARLAHIHIDPQTGMVKDTVQILPPRIPNCTPETIRQYIAQPPDWAHLKPEEQYIERPLTEQQQREREDDRQQVELEIETARLSRAQLLASAGAAQAQQVQSQQAAVQAQVASVQQPAQQQPVQPQSVQQQQPQQPQQPQQTPEQIQAQREAEAKARQQQQEQVAAQARAAVANPMAGGGAKEVGPGAIPQQPPVASPPQQAPQGDQATEFHRQAVQDDCLKMFSALGYNGKKALVKLKEYNPNAGHFKDLTDDQFASLHGFLSDALAMKQGAEGNAQDPSQGN